MTRALFWISLLLCILTGSVHTVIGLVSFEPLSPNLVWFIAAGLALLLTAALNLAAWRALPTDRLVRWMAHSFNILMVGLGVLLIRAVPGSRSYATLIALIGLLLSSFIHDRASRRDTASGSTLQDDPRTDAHARAT